MVVSGISQTGVTDLVSEESRMPHKLPLLLDTMRKTIQRLLCQRRFTLTRVLVIFIILSSMLVILNVPISFWKFKTVRKYTPPPTPIKSCNILNLNSLDLKSPKNHDSSGVVKISRKVLILVESQFSKNAKNIVSAMEMARYPYKVVDEENNLPTLIHMGKGRFGVIIFETLKQYLNLDHWSKQLIDKYCQQYEVGMVLFVKPQEEYEFLIEKIPELSLTVQYNVALKEYKLNGDSPVWRIVRPGGIISDTFPDFKEDWAIFLLNHSTYEPLAFATQTLSLYDDYEPSSAVNNKTVFPAVLDNGLNDGIKRVFFGQDFSFWLHSPMLMDCISYLSHGKLSLSLDRFIQIDIDDIFVAAPSTRMKAEDVVALAATQERLRQIVDGFQFLLGFSGWYYQHGTEEENEGDRMLIKYKNLFLWFPHMWRHEQPHKFTEEELQKTMQLNHQFAEEHKLPVIPHYAVSPHHSGVFPIHEPLYGSWKSVWDIRVTSTEEYPRLNPSWGRKGFIHRKVMVLPRQTCGLFTHTVFLSSYPGGQGKLERSIQGGDLFKYFLYNPVNIFMTHLSNYGNDRLALYTFESAIRFVQCWTNLKLKQETPMDHAIKYFDLYPDEKLPIWRNPCEYDRHLEIWSVNKTCEKFPKFLVIGPQKTGTTALYTFLSMHPMIKSNIPSKETFEEIQFFSGNNYLNGIDWYLDFFPMPNNSSVEYLFEKSATYFDNSNVPKRAHALLPNAKIICILINPAHRAYSWYQHIKAHGDPMTVNNTFYDIVTAPDTARKEVRTIRNRCLNPGMYEYHLNNWLDYYSSRQLFIIDGDSLKSNPLDIMEKLQTFLGVETYLDYSKVIRFDQKKGFFCQVLSDNKTRCLGRSKGRQYPPMDALSVNYLKQFYRKHNIALSHLLERIQFTKPAWLEDELNS